MSVVVYAEGLQFRHGLPIVHLCHVLERPRQHPEPVVNMSVRWDQYAESVVKHECQMGPACGICGQHECQMGQMRPACGNHR